MNQIFTFYSGLFLVAASVSFFISFLAWQRRSVKGARDLARLMIATGIWAFFIIFETGAPSLASKIIWAKFEYFGAVSAPVLYLIFVLRFSGNDKYLSIRNTLLLFVLPAMTMILAFTNENHYLLWSGFSEISAKTNIMEYYHGIWFWVGYLGYSFLLFFISTIYLVVFIFRHTRVFRFQGWIVLIASICPWISVVLYLAKINISPGVDLVPLTIILSGSLLFYSIFFFRFLDLGPIAREKLVETMSDGILALDSQNRIRDINRSALSFLGISHKDIIGSQAEYSGATAKWLLDAVIGQNSGCLSEQISADGSKTFRINKQEIVKHPGCHLVVIQDITGFVAQEVEIRAGEERYRQLFSMFRLMADNMPDMLWAKDLNKKLIFANKSVCENLLCVDSIEDPIGKTHLFFAERERLKHPEVPDWYTFGENCQDSDQVVMDSGKMEHFDEFGNVRGNFLFLDVWKAPIFDQKGVMIGVVGSGRDVTVQKKAEAEVLKRGLLLGAISQATDLLIQEDNLEECINGALKIVGQAVGVNRVYIFQNHFAEGFKMPLISQSYEWTDGTVLPQIDNPDLQNVPYEIQCPRWFETLSADKVIVGNVSEFPESERIALESQGIKSLLVTPVFIDKVFWGFIGFDDCEKERDWPIPEEQLLTAAANTIGSAYLRKKNQAELIEAKNRAEQSDHLKSAFLANMSHEIRTPMNGILGFAELLKEPDLDQVDQQKYVEIIENSATRLLTLINDLVDLSKIESGQMGVTISKTNINEQIESIYDFFSPEVKKKGMQLTIKSNLIDRSIFIQTDREKLYATLINLVKNAIKFTNQGTITVGYEKKGDFLEYFVRDTGIGIPKDHQKLIFNRFIQANQRKRRAEQGTGLGLSIAKAYVEMLGGKIWVESEEGKGSVFYFTIPYKT